MHGLTGGLQCLGRRQSGDTGADDGDGSFAHAYLFDGAVRPAHYYCAVSFDFTTVDPATAIAVPPLILKQTRAFA
ncbi:hypothetical protein STUTZSP0542_32910 [Stutzerimonas marianensis]